MLIKSDCSDIRMPIIMKYRSARKHENKYKHISTSTDEHINYVLCVFVLVSSGTRVLDWGAGLNPGEGHDFYRAL